LYHFNRTNQPGKDCGDAWIEDEEVGLQFFCNTCMERQKSEDQEQMAQLARAAATGSLTPELVAQAMQAMANQSGANTPFLSGFPGLTQPGPSSSSIPGAGAFSEPISGAELMSKLGITPPAGNAPDAESSSAAPGSRDTPPPLRTQRKPPRRYRRID
jgi:hypothetical protein